RYILPINRQSAMYQYAQTLNLGGFLSAQFPLRYQGVEYRGQVFERGIVFIRADGVGEVSHVGL
ncbi:hypothetical protein ACFLXQ_09085, partial [Chloroflexota bacterium]